MIGALRTARKLVLGETWALPLAVGAAVGVAVLVRAIAGPHGWWSHGGGFIVLVAVVGALLFAVRRSHPGRRR